jgi:hypothetical protein
MRLVNNIMIVLRHASSAIQEVIDRLARLAGNSRPIPRGVTQRTSASRDRQKGITQIIQSCVSVFEKNRPFSADRALS